MKRIPALALALLLLIMTSALPACAASVNSHEVAIGDTVTYEIHAISCTSKVEAIDISIYYDSTSLRLVDNSFETPALKEAVTNTDLLGEVRFNAISVRGWDFSSDKVLAKVRFEVIDDLSSDISLYYNVKNFLDENKTELKDTYTFDMTSVGSESAGAESAVSSKSAESATSKAPVTESKPESEKTDPSEASDNEVIFDLTSSGTDTPSTDIITEQDSIPSDKAIMLDTVDTPSSASKKHINSLYLMILLCGVGIVVLIGVVFVIIIKDDSKGSHYSK